MVAASQLFFYLDGKSFMVSGCFRSRFSCETPDGSNSAYEASMSTLMGEFEWYVQMAGREISRGTETRIFS